MAEASGVVWLNGALLPAPAARIDPADRGLLLGDGVFETLAVRGGAVRDVARHLARLQAGAAVLRLAVPFELTAALEAVRAANAVTEGFLRVTLTRGVGPRGVLPGAGMVPTVLITGGAMTPAAGAMSVVIAQTVRRDEQSPLSAVKSLNYLPSILARLEAAARGADDALLLNYAGRLAEASAGTLFVRLAEEWLTPPVSDGALPGVLRGKLLEAGTVREAALEAGDLFNARAVCVGNVLGVRAVRAVDGRELRWDEGAVVVCPPS
jgi:branched-chain amino acid aminotransferase